MPDRKVKATGSKVEVWHGTAKHTAGGLKKEDLMQNKRGKIVSRSKHQAGLTTGKQNLGAYLVGSGGAPRRSARSKSQKGSGFLGDLLGFGLPEAGGAPAYSSRGGRLPARRRKQKGGGIFGSIGDVVDHVF